MNCLLFLKQYNPTFYKILKQEKLILSQAFLVWEKPKDSSANHFYSSNHNPNKGVYGVLVGLIVIETCIVDLVLVKFEYYLLAKLSIFSSLYLLIIMIAYFKALKFRPTQLDANGITIQYGLNPVIEIPYSAMTPDQPSSEPREIVPLGLLSKLEEHNVGIVLKNYENIQTLYGKEKKGNEIRFFVSEKQKFMDLLQENIKIEYKRI
ncbi:MAG: hypothetical protein ACRCVT_06670 [Leadbetterella sp.]